MSVMLSDTVMNARADVAAIACVPIFPACFRILLYIPYNEQATQVFPNSLRFLWLEGYEECRRAVICTYPNTQSQRRKRGNGNSLIFLARSDDHGASGAMVKPANDSSGVS